MKLRGLFLVPVVALSLATPGYAANRAPATADAGELVWPLPPDPPRIRYVETLRGDDHYAKKKGRWKRFLVGPDTDPGLTLHKPYGVVSDVRGRIYVSDTGLGAVVVFDPENREVRTLGQNGRVRLSTPVGLAIDERGRLFVSDPSLDTVFCFDEEERVALALGHSEGMQNPSGIAIDRQRHRLYVADSHLHEILVYTTDGAFVTRWGKRGSGAGQLNFPTNVAIAPNGDLYVVDTGNFRVQVFDPEGRVKSSFGEAGDGFGSFHRPKGIALDSDGHAYVVDAAFNNFQIFDGDGRLLLFVGAAGQEPGSFWLPAGIHIDAQDHVYVVDQINRRVQVFQYLGE